MIGRILGHYRIVDKLGQGGMGEVYRARDTRLDREVALKLLPPQFATDPERVARFEREAKAIATLKHPNIVTLYSVEEADGVVFSTMELVEGRRLSEEIPPQGLSWSRFFDLAIQLLDAVVAAHAKGITHRDLKPANIMLDQDGRVKVLDFGLAKLVQPSGDPQATVAIDSTVQGAVLGTVPYMSPEQVVGKTVDHRSDIFSTGAVLYEMCTGRPPFAGDSHAEIMSSILRDDVPPPSAVRSDAPRELDRIVRHCLEKDLQQRFQSTLDVRNELVSLRDDMHAPSRPSPAGVPPPRRGLPRAALPIALAAVAALVVWRQIESRRGAAGGSSAGDRPLAAAPPAQATPEPRLSQLTFAPELEEWPAWSPDETSFVCTMERDGYKKLVVHRLGDNVVTDVTHGTKDDLQPAWSPDGSAVAFVRATTPNGKLQPADVFDVFYEGGDIWQVDPRSGQDELLVRDAFNPSFSPDGSLLAFDADYAGPRRIWTTDRRGRNPKQITSDVSEALVHTDPSWSPDGTKIAFRRIEKTRSDIEVIDLRTNQTHLLTDDAARDMDPAWSPRGDFIYLSSYRGGGQNVWRIPVGPDGQRTGPSQQITKGAGHDLQIAVGAKGDRLLFSVLGINSDLWVLPLDPHDGKPTGEPQPLVATTREDSRGAWAPDGKTLAFNSDRLGEMNIWVRSLADGSERALTHGPGGDYQASWSPDGTTLVFFSSRDATPDIWTVRVATLELQQLTRGSSLDSNPFWSPDGRRIAFQSDRDGRKEVWLMNADGSEARRLSTVGAYDHFMRWMPDSRTLVFPSASAAGVTVYQMNVESGQLTTLPPIKSGAHMSFSPDRSQVLDVAGHRTLSVFPLGGGEPRKVFEFADPDIRIDYPNWSTDGRALVFDRVLPQGGDIWLLEAQD